MEQGWQHRGRSNGKPDSVDLESAARRAVCHTVKTRARQYLRHPARLEALYPGLSLAPAATLVAVAEHLVERERASPRRWFGFGGEVGLTNARAALVLGRALRRAADREHATPVASAGQQLRRQAEKP